MNPDGKKIRTIITQDAEVDDQNSRLPGASSLASSFDSCLSEFRLLLLITFQLAQCFIC